jgi:hypothetical protein
MSTPRRLSRSLPRRLLATGLAVAGLVLLAAPFAVAGDAISNVSPPSQLPGGSLANAYPLGNYALDHHFSAVDAGVFSGVDASGIAPTIAWFLAQMVWLITAFLANAVITLFTLAFSLDLVNGSSATGGTGALAPVGEAVRAIYRDTFGQPWLVVSILLTGMWAMWQALVRRRYTETAGALGLSLVFVIVALAFVTRPEIIGQASRWTNQMSSAFLALSSHGELSNTQAAKQTTADQLFSLLVYEPWAVLNFGGLEHCVSGSGEQQRTVPVRPLSLNPGRDRALARRLASATQIQADGKVCINHRNKYAPHFLRFAPETEERNAEHEALEHGDTGKLPDADPAKSDGSYRLGEVDKPAAEAMGKGGQYQRLLLALVIFGGELGAFLLLGAIAALVILAQILLLLVLAFAPVALVLGVFPGRGHEFFKGWLARLGSYLLRKAQYSLVLAVLLAVNGALADATSSLGWFLSFMLQAAFFWTVLLNRRQLVGQLNHVLTGRGKLEPDGLGRAAVLAAAATRVATHRGHQSRRLDSQPEAHTAPPHPPAAPAAASGSSSMRHDLSRPEHTAAAGTSSGGATAPPDASGSSTREIAGDGAKPVTAEPAAPCTTSGADETSAAGDAYSAPDLPDPREPRSVAPAAAAMPDATPGQRSDHDRAPAIDPSAAPARDTATESRTRPGSASSALGEYPPEETPRVQRPRAGTPPVAPPQQAHQALSGPPVPPPAADLDEREERT